MKNHCDEYPTIREHQFKINFVGTGVLDGPRTVNIAKFQDNGPSRTPVPTGLVLHLDVTVAVRFGIKP